jgi:transposase-like protein
VEIKEDLENILSLGIQIESITCDGHKSILKAVKKVCDNIILQRCTVHVQRECKIWLTTNPKSEAGASLLKISNKLSQINTHQKAQVWIKEFIDWHSAYQSFVKEKSINSETGRYWYKHKMVRRAFIHIKNALPDLFQYLFNDRVPKSTNGLESFFGHLKSHLLLHRGMTMEHRKNFIRWYLYFKNKE